MKEITSKSTPINIAARRICEEIKIQQDNYHAEINRQRGQLPVLVDRSKFCLIGELITHQCIEFISRELDAVKLLAEDFARRVSTGSEDLSESNGIGCASGCELTMRYGLPCKCWLYRSVVDEIPIPLSLIHLRWLFGSDFVPQGVVGR